MNVAVRTASPEIASQPADPLDHLADVLFHKMGADGVYARTALYEDMVDRLQSFRMREYVCIGSPSDVSDFRERWMERAQGIARDLGLTFRVDYASDPFFGRVGQVMAVSQKQQSLKFELLVPLRSEEQPTACMSFNYHRDHFGLTWDIKDVKGEPAHTGCVAFGMDRLAVAMFHTHGTDLAKWPAEVRKILELR